MSSLSLYRIEAAFLDLLTAREEVLAGEQGPDTPAELAEIEKALSEYGRGEVVKVDGIHAYLGWAKATAEEARRESAAMAERARRIEAGMDRVKSICLDAMQMIGKKRIDGTAGRYLSVAGNSGVQPLGVQEDMVPAGLRDVTVKMPLDAWQAVQLHAPQDPVSAYAVRRAKVVANEPSNGRIREALAQPCGKCKGVGAPWNNSASVPCEDCGGTGNGSVPGCTLLERGVHLRVR